MTRVAVAEAVRAACLRVGCPELLSEIAIGGEGPTTAILRPLRALTDREAFTMCAAWFAGYQAAGIPICPGDCEDDCGRECVPNYDSEEVVLGLLPGLKRPSTWIGRG